MLALQPSRHVQARSVCHMRMRAFDWQTCSRGRAAGLCRTSTFLQNNVDAQRWRSVVLQSFNGNRSRGNFLRICQAHLTHKSTSHSPTPPAHGPSQQERFLAFDNAPIDMDDDDHDHEAPMNDSTVHKVIAWVFSRVGLLQLASQLRGKAWNAITITCLMAVALLTAWLSGTQALQTNLCQQISTAATAGIYLLAGIPELVDLCFDLTAGHIDTHVLMTLAVFGTLAIGGALEVNHNSPHTSSRQLAICCMQSS